MDYYQLHCFKITAQYQSITKAAAELHISQPSLSQTIRRLEEELGYPLFDRTHKKIRINASGEVLYKRVCQMEALMENTKIELDEMNHVSKPIVTLHVECASMLLPKLLLFLKNAYPMIEFQVYQWNHVKNRDDKGLWLLAEKISDTDILLLEEEFRLVLPKQHPLVLKDKLYLDDLQGEQFIQLTDQWSLEQMVGCTFHQLGFAPHVTMQFDNPGLMREILKNQMGLAFVPSVTWDMTGENTLVMRKVEDCDIHRSIYLHNPEGFVSKEHRMCAEGIESFFRQLS